MTVEGDSAELSQPLPMLQIPEAPEITVTTESSSAADAESPSSARPTTTTSAVAAPVQVPSGQAPTLAMHAPLDARAFYTARVPRGGVTDHSPGPAPALCGGSQPELSTLDCNRLSLIDISEPTRPY